MHKVSHVCVCVCVCAITNTCSCILTYGTNCYIEDIDKVVVFGSFLVKVMYVNVDV